MLLRRLSGLVLALLTLHLNVLGADFACATHPADGHDMSQAAPTQDMPMQGMPMQDMAMQDMPASEHAMHQHEGVVAVADTDAPPPCELPVQPECCKALTSCSIVFSAAAELAANDGVTAREARTPSVTSALPNERAAPEPPPPKA